PQRLLVFVERADRVDGAPARLPVRMGAAGSRPSDSPDAARDARAARRMRGVDEGPLTGTPPALRISRGECMKKYFGLLKESYQEFAADKAARLGAALAYYTIFSIAPLVLIAIAIAGMVFGQEAAQHEITGQLK